MTAFVGSLSSRSPSGDVVPELCNRRTSLLPATALRGLMPIPPFICSGVPTPAISPPPAPPKGGIGSAPPPGVPARPPPRPVEDDSVVVGVVVCGGGVSWTAPSPKISCATTSCACNSDCVRAGGRGGNRSKDQRYYR